MRKTSGISLMVLIFLSLCLITFSLLSLSGATADETLSRKAADRTTEYYAAVTAANDILAEIDEALAGYLKKAAGSREDIGSRESTDGREDIGSRESAGSHETGDQAAEYLEACASISDTVPEASWSDGKITFSVPVNEDQVLRAELTIAYPRSEDDTLYRVTAWETVSTREWDADRSQNVFRTGDKG